MNFLSFLLLLVLLAGCSEEKLSESISSQSINNASVSSVVAEVSNTGAVSAVSASVYANLELAANDVKMQFDATDPKAPLEVAMLYEGVVMPVFSISNDPPQFMGQSVPLSLSNSEQEERLNCGPEIWCKLPLLLMARHHGLNSLPLNWFDAAGKAYEVSDGAYFEADTGNIVGFNLKVPHKALVRREDNGRVLVNKMGGFSAARVLGEAEWKSWTELQHEIHAWEKEMISSCKSNKSKLNCMQSVNWLVGINTIQGSAKEYLLKNGTKLQHLQAESHSKGEGVLTHKPDFAGDFTSPDSLKINLWRLVSADGSVRVLKIDDDWLAVLGNTKLIDPYCESQCGPSWGGELEVISTVDRSFIIGPYSGGTVSGFLFFEVLPNQLKFLGWYRWGS